VRHWTTLDKGEVVMTKRKAKGEKKEFKISPTTQGQNYTDRNLIGVSPLSEQFEPTDASPIKTRRRMAGVS
jgi:hypothetical protein